mmetsp:Transcript_2063/g.2972  ORF Transcript_2063/g.2972 Transcript_2063/m.2972 type:complete len:389 (-) Transcript_2063:133-1299(-)
MGISQSRLFKKHGDDENKPTDDQQQQQLSHFPQFYLLSDEIVLEILSFVTQAPFEFDKENIGAATTGTGVKVKGSSSKPSFRSSSLTHTLPFVSKQFYKLCKYDQLWIQSLRNLVKNDPNQWKYAFTSLLLCYDGRIANPTWSSYHNSAIDKNDFILASKVKHMDTLNKDDFNNFIMDVYKSVTGVADVDGGVDNRNDIAITRHSSITCNNKYSFCTIHGNLNSTNDDEYNNNEDFGSGRNRAKEFYLTLVINYVHITMPIFQMRHPSLRKGTYMDLTFFEPRYRKLISDIMKGRKTGDYKGRTLKYPRPKFIFANGENINNNDDNGEELTLGSASDGYIVEVCKCLMLHGGQAQIRIHVLQRVKIFSRKERAELNIGLYDAHIKRFH